jgi:hypothetical protein
MGVKFWHRCGTSGTAKGGKTIVNRDTRQVCWVLRRQGFPLSSWKRANMPGVLSHVGNFATEEEANRWIATESKNWPDRMDKLK